MRKLFRAGVVAFAVASVVALCALLMAGPVAAESVEHISSYDIDITVGEDGSAVFRETIVFDFGSNARHGIDRVLTTLQGFDDSNDRSYPLTVVTVASVDAPSRYEVSDQGGGRQRIRIGDPRRTISGRHVYSITYRLDGVVNGQLGDDEFFWNVVGDEWTVVIDRLSVRVEVPGGPTRLACFVGERGSTDTCDLQLVDAVNAAGPAAVFRHGAMRPGDGLTVVVAIPDTNGDALEPAPVLVERTLRAPRGFDDMFARTPLSLGAGAVLAMLFAGGIARLQYRVGRDRKSAGSATDAAFSDQTSAGEPVPLRDVTPTPVEFVPPDGLRPAQLGLLRDEVVGNEDIAATIIDLAVRGYLRIEEVPAKITDYRFTRLDGRDPAVLLEYERHLFEKLFATGQEVLLSSLKNTFAGATARTKTLLYENAQEHAWFAGRPDHVRTIWALAGFVVLVAGAIATFFLAQHSRYGLVGVPLVGAGLAMLIGSRWMPRRTPKGTGLVRRTRGFEDFIQNSEKHRAEFAERTSLFTEYLPYAVAFGAVARWANALAVLGLPPPDTSSWYVGPGPVVWSTFGDRMATFTTNAATTLTSTPGSSGGSGFSGGSSGGGGGGGGGGSW